ncbi:MAG: hypothetical protein C4293_20930, partial [Nitrospiraceae bacterium]
MHCSYVACARHSSAREGRTMAEAAEEKVPVPVAGVPIKTVILIVMAALVLGIGGGIVFLKFNANGKAAEQSTENQPPSGARATSAPKTSSTVKSEPGVIYDLDPFIVNLADSPESRYLKLTIKLELDSHEASVELAPRLPHVRDTILILLSSKDAASLRTVQGK